MRRILTAKAENQNISSFKTDDIKNALEAISEIQRLGLAKFEMKREQSVLENHEANEMNEISRFLINLTEILEIK